MVRRRSSRPAAPERAADASAVRSAAATLLARRDYSSGELNSTLTCRGFDGATVAEVLAELVAAGTVDDARFALNYVTWHAGRGQGPVRIGADLRRLGLADERVRAALASEHDWRTLARRVRAGKFGAQAPANWAEKARQARFLQYRGFSADHIRAATGAEFDTD